MPATEDDLASRVELLRKVLGLERAQGLRDRAVVGGLEAFVARHLPQGAELVAGYASLSPAARAAALEKLEELLACLAQEQPRPEDLLRPVEEAPGVGKKRAPLLR
ncbi:TPA: hypothetical protein EYH33_00925, partial [Candidatus Bipolaricaulota bacterium]|nr:hypothetical protein [Candidatus Bipolaricaulota bacterium]